MNKEHILSFGKYLSTHPHRLPTIQEENPHSTYYIMVDTKGAVTIREEPRDIRYACRQIIDYYQKRSTQASERFCDLFGIEPPTFEEIFDAYLSDLDKED